jgi:nicotinate-nucleotide pyrophosphorylase (carboxylating)
MMNSEELFSIEAIVKNALAEDLGEAGDITSQAIFDAKTIGRACIKSKEAGVLSGAYLLQPIFTAVHPSLIVTCALCDGAALSPGAVICTVSGPLRAILAGERLALNFLQRLSGIATATSACVKLISHTQTKLLDTRKTTPLLRLLEKRAVLHGGGVNHRFGLFDMILIKDTHVKAAGGVTRALTKARAYVQSLKSPVKIEVEVQTRQEFLEAVSLTPDRIMLDNMGNDLMAECVGLLRKSGASIELEASGNISIQTIAAVAQTGVDFISMGSLTHSVKALDIHLVIE